MRSKDEGLMQKIATYVGDYYRREHVSPSTRDIAAALGRSNGCIYKYLVEMDKRGMLRYENGIISGLKKVIRTETEYFSAPIVGSVRCGDPEDENEDILSYVDLPRNLFGDGEFYMLFAKGDSMEDKDIFEGDLLLIQRRSTCSVGDIVVAKDENQENTLKVYGGVDARKKKAILRYANEKVYPGKVILVKELEIQGVVKNIIKWA
ncbi:MAG: repressor LexA [Oscillospiraceae bacterium]|nr:repressor LexA [Oscillospiraceae bacterium]